MQRVIFSLIGIMVMLLLLLGMSPAQDRTIRRQDAPASAASGTERRVALVIGNGGYKSAPLRNPLNDAKDMAATLKSLEFEVIEKLDADKRVMEEALEEFYRRLLRAEIGLFYYSGHGMQVESTNYLIPVGVPITSESDVRYAAFNAGRVLGKMKDVGNCLNIVILDACRDNPFERSFRSSSLGLAQMDAPTGTIIAYATSPGSVAGDGPGRNGIFTKHLIENLRKPGVSLQELFNETGLSVMKETKEKQVPWVSSTPVPRYALAGEAIPAQPVGPEPAPAPSYGEEVGRDGVYVAYSNGIVKDTKKGLEWVAGPDRDMTWDEAKAWVESLNVGGGGWRMPTMKELGDLYEKDKESRHMTSLLKTTGWFVWSGNKYGSSGAWVFYWVHNQSFQARRDHPDGHRAFAVRSRSGG